MRARLPRAEAARFARYLVAGTGHDEASASDRSRRAPARPDAEIPSQAYEATPGSTRPASRQCWNRGSVRSCRPESRSNPGETLCRFVQPRSGLAARHGIRVVNSPGLIDSGYRGEIRVVLLNTGREPFSVEVGMQIAQLVVAPVASVRLVEVDELAASGRRHGFGSSAS